jgi:hypothetical protein
MEKLNHNLTLTFYNSLDGAPNVITPDLFLCLMALTVRDLPYSLQDVWDRLKLYRYGTIRYAMLLQLRNPELLIPPVLKSFQQYARVSVSKKNRLEGKLIFKAHWKYAFDSNLDTMEPFHEEPNKIIKMMHRQAYVSYYQDASYQLVELPMADDRHVVGFILPQKWKDEITELGQYNQPLLASHELNEMINNLSPAYVNVSIPLMKGRKIYCLKNLQQKRFWGGGSKMINAVSFISYTMAHSGEEIPDKNKETAIDFNANHVFCFYLRDTFTNCFLIYGDYQG